MNNGSYDGKRVLYLYVTAGGSHHYCWLLQVRMQMMN